MQETYNFKEEEKKAIELWEKEHCFTPRIEPGRRPFSMFLVPPNASGPMHVGNALMIAIQDVLARYHRAKGDPTLWIPSTDHGGYETQITYERELSEEAKMQDLRPRAELVGDIGRFVDRNNETIVRQVKALGASVDWSRFRFTLDDTALASANDMFKRMVEDRLIYRKSYMVHYCPTCATVLADIELKQQETDLPLYHIRFPFEGAEGHLVLALAQPEFLFSITHVLIHPQDTRYSHLIGKTLLNPATGKRVHMVASKRKFEPADMADPLAPLCPSHDRYDYEYALRNNIPYFDLLEWDGTLTERHPGLRPEEARPREIEYLKAHDAVERVDETHRGTISRCKKGHAIEHIVRLTWFLKLDDDRVPLRKPALDAIKAECLTLQPRWREKGLIEWIGKMHDWPIARQNVWGINIPVWYEVTDPAQFTVWFYNKEGLRQYGNLKAFLDAGIAFEEIVERLERVYATDQCAWALERKEGKTYLPETDTFDTWFSSGAWSAMVFGPIDSSDLAYFYPNDVVVVGHDLLRLSIAREIVLGKYLTGKLPFRQVRFHGLVKAKDGLKMSKSLGNAISLDTFIDTYSADATRMALLANTARAEDFILSDEQLTSFRKVTERLWKMGRVCEVAFTPVVGSTASGRLTNEDTKFISALGDLSVHVAQDIERFALSSAQEKVVACLSTLEVYALAMSDRDDISQAMTVFREAFKKYLILAHPFMPFITETIHTLITPSSRPLATMQWPARNRR